MLGIREGDMGTVTAAFGIGWCARRLNEPFWFELNDIFIVFVYEMLVRVTEG